LAAGPAAIRAATRGYRKQFVLAAGHHLRRGSLPNEKVFSPLNLAIVRPIVFKLLKKDKSKFSLKRNRLKASVNPSFRTALLTC
jgi:hypothetical protein